MPKDYEDYTILDGRNEANSADSYKLIFRIYKDRDQCGLFVQRGKARVLGYIGPDHDILSKLKRTYERFVEVRGNE
jgi:hypothetical protein